MTKSPPHHQDVELVERCLSGQESAISRLRENNTGTLRGWLLEAGASRSEADELIETIWTDCVVGLGDRQARLFKYHGDCAIGLWLKAVVVNAFIDQRRRASRQESFNETAPRERAVTPELMEQPLTELMEQALQAALRQCPAESLVMVQLRYLQGLKQIELARMWACPETQVSRTLKQTLRGIEDQTMRAIKRRDPWLELSWQDFLELCDGAGSLFYQ